MTLTPFGWLWASYPNALVGWLDMGPFSCHAEAADGGFSCERFGHVRHCLSQGAGVDSGGLYRSPGHPVFPSPQFLRIAHVGLDRVLDGLGLLLGFLDQGLQLAQLPDLAFEFVIAHGMYLLLFLWVRRRGASVLLGYPFENPVPPLSLVLYLAAFSNWPDPLGMFPFAMVLL